MDSSKAACMDGMGCRGAGDVPYSLPFRLLDDMEWRDGDAGGEKLRC